LTNDQGQATSPLVSQGPFSNNGLVIVLAHTVGQEPFIDNNGNGVFDAGTDTITNDSVPEPFIDHNGNCAFDPGDPFEIFIDVNGNLAWDAVQGTPGVWDDDIFVWNTIPMVFSSSTVTSLSCFSGSCDGSSFTIPNGGSATFDLVVRDANGNPLTSESDISLELDGAGEVAPTDFEIPDTTNCGATTCGDDPASFDPADCGDFTGSSSLGITHFRFTVSDSDTDETDPAEPSTVTIEITSPLAGTGDTAPGGNGSVELTIFGTVD
jgi:hypothetical protein